MNGFSPRLPVITLLLEQYLITYYTKVFTPPPLKCATSMFDHVYHILVFFIDIELVHYIYML